MKFFHSFYVQPMNNVYIEMAAMYLIWLIVMLLLRKNAQRILTAVCCALSVGVILFFTLYRDSGNKYEISLIPFITFTKIKTNSELLRSMIMNVFLFIPFGLSAPFVLPENTRKKVLIATLAGLVLSIFVEICQFVFTLGRFETDDIIMNTFGALAGATAFLLYCGIKKLINKRRKS